MPHVYEPPSFWLRSRLRPARGQPCSARPAERSLAEATCRRHHGLLLSRSPTWYVQGRACVQSRVSTPATRARAPVRKPPPAWRPGLLADVPQPLRGMAVLSLASSQPQAVASEQGPEEPASSLSTPGPAPQPGVQSARHGDAVLRRRGPRQEVEGGSGATQGHGERGRRTWRGPGTLPQSPRGPPGPPWGRVQHGPPTHTLRLGTRRADDGSPSTFGSGHLLWR